MPFKEGFRNKRIVLYARRNVGLLALIFFISKKKKSLKVISDDVFIIEHSKKNKIPIVTFETMGGYDLFFCVHGNKILPPKYLKVGHAYNIHPCLSLYRGSNPIRRYIDNGNTFASVECHQMTEIVDDGPLIHRETFETGEVKTYEAFYNIAFPFYLKCLQSSLQKIGSEIRGEPSYITEIIGKKYGHLTVIGFSFWKNGQPMIKVKCDCGKEKNVNFQSIKSGATLSCGCFNRKRLQASKSKHGHAKRGKQTKLFRVWCAMRARCYNKNNDAYENYGGRGITVCERWIGKDGFFNFLNDMGERPSDGHSIDRIDNEKGYSPENCKWATKAEQLNNKRNNRKVLICGEEMTATQAAKKYGVSPAMVLSRLRQGWPIEEALNTPKSGKK